MRKYQLITDATADLAPKALNEIPELEIIPMEVILDGEVRIYGPGGDLSVEEFYEALRQGKYGSTSQINQNTYMQYFEKYLKRGQDILYLCLSTGLSATYQNACICANELKEKYPQRSIKCIDSLCACAGEGLFVYDAAKRWQDGACLEELFDWMIKRRLNVCHWFTVDTMEFLKKGGRVNAAAAAVGTILQIKPLLRIDEDGRLVLAGKPRGRRQAQEEKIRCLKESWNPSLGRTIMIAHGDCYEEAAALKEEIEAQFVEADCMIAPVGPIIGMHTGPGMVACCFWGTR
ncbi:MAG: DegV family protein [Hespellia sp.]|nr:DegV family protein [Hespellia sp.]